jgi:hypothetical protein
LIGEQRTHLGDGYLIELDEPFALQQFLTDKDGVDAFQIGEHNKLFQRGVIADIARFGDCVAFANIYCA